MVSNKNGEGNKKTLPLALNTPPQSPKSPKLKRLVPLIVIMLLGLVLVVLFCYTKHLIKKLDKKVNLLTQQQLITTSTITAINNTVNQEQLHLENKLKSLTHNIEKLIAAGVFKNETWMLFKAKYYLELAQIHAKLDLDQQTTLALLQEALLILQHFTMPPLILMRDSLAKEIAEFKNLPKINLIKILNELNTIQKNLDKLTARKINNDLQGNNKNLTSPEATNLTKWQTEIQSSWQMLKKLIIIQRNDENLQLLLSPYYQALAKENIRMNLQAAEWAVLQNNHLVYQLILEQTINNIQRLYTQNTITTELITDLKNLQQERLSAPRHLLGESLLLLNKYLENANIDFTPSSPLVTEPDAGSTE